MTKYIVGICSGEIEYMEDIAVSIICTVYNHEKYLRECLDGFVNQRTNFKYQVIVHDDASTDNSASIIREYEKKYPSIINPIYQIKNQYSQSVKITRRFIMPLIKGKYVAICEGDDYWCNPYKLQMQYDALEMNPNCYFSVGKTMVIDEDGTPTSQIIADMELNNGGIPPTEFLNIVFHNNVFHNNGWQSFHTSTFFVNRSKYEEYQDNYLFMSELSGVGDLPMLLYFGQLGNVYFCNELLSAYRHNSINNWTSRNKNANYLQKSYNATRMIKMYEEFDMFTNRKYHELCMMKIKNLKIEECRYGGCYKHIFSKNLITTYLKLPTKYKIVLFLEAISPRFRHYYAKGLDK